MATWECSVHSRSMLDSMNALKDEEQFCDITIVTGRDEIKAHKFVLIAASEYFRAMFSCDTKESRTGIVSFPDAPGDVVTQCINFIYSGKVDFSLEHIIDFMKASDIFCLHNLTNLYVKFLSGNISMDNVEEMLSAARVYQKELLKTSIQIFLRNNLRAFIESEKLQSSSKDNFLYLLSLVHNWGKEYEMLKWNAIVTWVKEELDERKDAFNDLFDTIDFSFLPRQFIKDHVIQEQLVSESVDLVLKIYDRPAIVDEKPSILPILPIEKATGIISCNGVTGVLYRYSLIEEEWSALTRLPPSTFMAPLDVAEYKGIIYITTGKAIFSFNGMKWKKLYWNDSGGGYNQCIGCNNYIVMITGNHAVVHEIDHAISSSIEMKRLYHCTGFAIASTEDCIYVIGGREKREPGSSYQINLRTMQCGWISKIPMSIQLSTGCVFEFNGIVYAFNGQTDNVVFYNEITNNWRRIKDFTIKHTEGCKVHIADKLYLYGGKLGTKIQSVKLEKLMVSERDRQPALEDADMELSCISFLK